MYLVAFQFLYPIFCGIKIQLHGSNTKFDTVFSQTIDKRWRPDDVCGAVIKRSLVHILFDFVCYFLFVYFLFKKYEVQLVKVYASNAVILLFMRNCVVKLIRNYMLPRPHVARLLGDN